MPTKGNTICVDCQIEFRVKKNGVTTEELTEDGTPYKKWQADLLQCPRCGFQVLTGFGYKPLAHSFEEKYDRFPTRFHFGETK